MKLLLRPLGLKITDPQSEVVVPLKPLSVLFFYTDMVIIS